MNPKLFELARLVGTLSFPQTLQNCDILLDPPKPPPFKSFEDRLPPSGHPANPARCRASSAPAVELPGFFGSARHRTASQVDKLAGIFRTIETDGMITEASDSVGQNRSTIPGQVPQVSRILFSVTVHLCSKGLHPESPTGGVDTPGIPVCSSKVVQPCAAWARPPLCTAWRAIQ